jgi:polyisoprenoid-binding protein YceI
MNSRLSVIALGGLSALAIAATAFAQGMPHPSQDYKAAPAGTYNVDPRHAGIVARVPHMGFSYSIFRFTTVNGKLTWDPANPGADKLDVTVDPKSIVTAAVPGFSDELAGEKFLNAAKFPTATFVSKAFHAESATHGKVEGDLTLMGVTKPAVFDVDLVGAGKGFRGPVIGVTARTMIDPKAYGLPALIVAPIELVIDTEFDG